MSRLKQVNTRESGNIGEKIAVSLLEKFNYKILDKNFRTKFGEIDIIAQDKDALVFVEVKTRFNEKFGKPEEAVNERKLQTIRKVAEYYLIKNPSNFKKLRIEVVAIELEKNKIKSAKIITV